MFKNLSRCLNYRILICTYSTSRLLSLTTNSGKVLLRSNKRCLLLPHYTPAFASMSTNIKAVTYDDVLNMKDNNEVLLVDVREPSELKEHGVIPGSINIPLGELENVLKNTSPDDFQKMYGRSKPALDFPITFSCMSGKRSERAAQAALKLGYTNVQNYSGGWIDYAQHLKNK